MSDSLKSSIKSYLSSHAFGEDKAVTRLELAAFFAPENERTIREAIRMLRMEGEPIGYSLSGGYYYAESWEELDQVFADLHKKAMAILVVEKGLKDGAARRFGPRETTQLSLLEAS